MMQPAPYTTPLNLRGERRYSAAQSFAERVAVKPLICAGFLTPCMGDNNKGKLHGCGRGAQRLVRWRDYRVD